MKWRNRLFLGVCAVAATVLGVVSAPAQGTTPAESRYQTASGFPGVDFGIYALQRLPQGHLLVVVQMRATEKVPPAGVLIGYAVPKPAVVLPKDFLKYLPKPFFLTGSTMTDEVTGAGYAMVDPVKPPGTALLDDATRAVLKPKQAVLLSMQFMAPPPPPAPPPGQPPMVQKLSFALPKAAGPIQHVPIPLPTNTKVDYLDH